MKINFLETLLWITIIVLFILILTRIFGKSPTDIQIYLAFFSSLLVIVGYIFKLNDNISKLNREVGEFKVKVINSFDRLKEDTNKIKKTLSIKEV